MKGRVISGLTSTFSDKEKTEETKKIPHLFEGLEGMC